MGKIKIFVHNFITLCIVFVVINDFHGLVVGSQFSMLSRGFYHRYI